jgi:glutaredoxin
MSEHKVKVYALSTCSHCRNAKKLLGECAVPFELVEVDLCDADEREKVIAEIRDLNPSLSFPTIVIDDQVIVGYKEQRILECLGLGPEE